MLKTTLITYGLIQVSYKKACDQYIKTWPNSKESEVPFRAINQTADK